MVDIQRSAAQAELGWHLTALERRILPTIRHYKEVHEQFSDAFEALQRHNSLADYINLPHQQSPEPVQRLQQQYEYLLGNPRRYLAIGKNYCDNPIPLLTGGKSGGIIDMRYFVPIYIMPELNGSMFRSR